MQTKAVRFTGYSIVMEPLPNASIWADFQMSEPCPAKLVRDNFMRQVRDFGRHGRPATPHHAMTYRWTR